jgi:hypothetical protein
MVFFSFRLKVSRAGFKWDKSEQAFKWILCYQKLAPLNFYLRLKTMKETCIIFLTLTFLSACHTPQYFVQKGNYDKAIEEYGSNLRRQKPHKKSKEDLIGLESAFTLAQRRDSTELAGLETAGSPENWPRINALHRQIQTRQQKVDALQPLRSRKGYVPKFSKIEDIAARQIESRQKAAAYLYDKAQKLLACTDSTGQRPPAREAYAALRDLKANYFHYWDQTNTLLDSAYQAGKAHILFEKSVENGVVDGSIFWECSSLGPGFIKNEWLVFYADPAARTQFDFRAKCRLVSLYVGRESTSSAERTETKQVEDGYDEKLDSAGHALSRTVKYKTETTTITTYHADRSANGTVLFELIDEHTGTVLVTRSIQGAYLFDETSETSAPSAPTYWGMIYRVAGRVEGDLRSELKKALLVR